MYKKIGFVFLTLLLLVGSAMAEDIASDTATIQEAEDAEDASAEESTEAEFEEAETTEVEVTEEVLAVETETEVETESDVVVEEVTDAGVTPDSVFYGIDKALDRIRLALERSPEGKAAKGLEIAQERLLEVKAMHEARNYEAAAEAEAEHGEVLTEVEASVEEIENDDASDELETEVELEAEVEKHKERVRDIKITIKGELTDEEAQAIVDGIVANLGGQTDSLDVKIENKKGKTKIRITQEGGDADAEEEALEEEHGVADKEQRSAEQALKNAEQQISKAQEKIDAEAAAGRDTTASVALLAAAQSVYAQAQAAFDAGDYETAEDLADDAWDDGNEARKGKNFDGDDEENETEEGDAEDAAEDAREKGKNMKDELDDEEDVEAEADVDVETDEVEVAVEVEVEL